jgi:phytoene synthase
MQASLDVAASYDQCRSLARTAARNFYYGFALLPPAKRDALCALYAFMRGADDISDSERPPEDKRTGLNACRRALDQALAGHYNGSSILPAFHHTVEKYCIPAAYFHDLISGAEMDLDVRRYPTFDRLRHYCYCVAGTVGLCCVHVFGFRDPVALELAPKLGIAFQLTNILRDIPEDFRMGRVYLPKFYEEGVRLQALVSEDSRAALWTLIRIYSGILRKIEAIQYDVLARPHPGLSRLEKGWIMLRAGAGLWR